MTETKDKLAGRGRDDGTSVASLPVARFEPRMPRLTAALVCIVAALTLLWPLLTGHILLGGERSDMYIAGYSFRLFGAETFRATGSIPQWNPYLFGGLPYIAAMHGDIFYPTAWLRWIMPVDLAITWGMAVHFVLAGWFTYLFARAVGLTWTAGVTAGVAYELSGIVASQMSPGHDGKLFVSALTPLAFFIVLRAVRDGRQWAYGVLAFVVALTVLGHYNMSYFLLLALGLWTLYLAFWDPTRTSTQNPWVCIGLAALAVVVGVGIAALQGIPFLEYLKFSPRADGAPDTGWAFATSYAMPPREMFTLILPQFNGVLDHYWGQNPIKFHTEYVGFLPLALATFAWCKGPHRRLATAFGIGAIVFLLFAFGGYSPLYRLLFNVLPYLSKIRAMGMVFFLPAFFVAMLAGIGLDRVLVGAVTPRTVLLVSGAFALFALLGATGGLQDVAEAMAIPERADAVLANAGELRAGALRRLAVRRVRRRDAVAHRQQTRTYTWGSGRRSPADRSRPVEHRPPFLPVFAACEGAVQRRRDYLVLEASSPTLSHIGRGRGVRPLVDSDVVRHHGRPRLPRVRVAVVRRAWRKGERLAELTHAESAEPDGRSIPDSSPTSGGAGVPRGRRANDDGGRASGRPVRARLASGVRPRRADGRESA